MNLYRRGSRTLRTWKIAGAVLTGLTLSACGQLPVQNGSALPQSPQAVSPNDQSGSSSEQTAGTSEGAGKNKPGKSPAKPKIDRCHTSQLAGSLENGDAGAGQRYVDLVLRNKSGETCTLYGYGGLQLIGADGSQVPTKLTREPKPAPATVRLAPGASARSTLHWTAVPADDEPQDHACEPTPARVQVIPPDETDPLMVNDWKDGEVCQHGAIDGTAYHQ